MKLQRQVILLNADEVADREHERYSPEAHDFYWNVDFTEVVIVPLAWTDDASYAASQGDGDYASDDDMMIDLSQPSTLRADGDLN